MSESEAAAMEAELRSQDKVIAELKAKCAELERENLRLQEENDANAFSISPAMYEAKIDQLNKRVAELATAVKERDELKNLAPSVEAEFTLKNQLIAKLGAKLASLRRDREQLTELLTDLAQCAFHVQCALLDEEEAAGDALESSWARAQKYLLARDPGASEGGKGEA
jgi:predicted RNase H-like nuclease (RuvC/YqgF family)